MFSPFCLSCKTWLDLLGAVGLDLLCCCSPSLITTVLGWSPQCSAVSLCLFSLCLFFLFFHIFSNLYSSQARKSPTSPIDYSTTDSLNVLFPFWKDESSFNSEKQTFKNYTSTPQSYISFWVLRWKQSDCGGSQHTDEGQTSWALQQSQYSVSGESSS